jgi:hypothetical protein
MLAMIDQVFNMTNKSIKMKYKGSRQN